MGSAPDAIWSCDRNIRNRPDRLKSYHMAGIVGDLNHSFGYHLSPNDLSSLGKYWSDYSMQKSRDKVGAKINPTYASAWDLGFDAEDMHTATKRLLNASRRGDIRMKGVSEFCGTLDGVNTYPWDVTSNSSEGLNSWDDSHLSHVHISFLRDVCNDYNAIKGVVDVICGSTQTEEFSMTPDDEKKIQEMIDASTTKVVNAVHNMFTHIGDPADHTPHPLPSWLASFGLELKHNPDHPPKPGAHK